ncbi:MAG: N-acetyltransferase [Gammaproteobacteria bacterium]|nr:MAG: N-acetyltransferase [Gammaproteobacteria bacterium]
MTIRFARLEDIPPLVELGHTYLAEGRLKTLGYDPDKLATNLKGLIEDKSGTRCFFVADDKNQKPYAALLGHIDSYFFSDAPIAQLIFFWVHPDHRGGRAAIKLMTAFKKWAENRKVQEISISVTSAIRIDKADTFFKKLGFQLTGGNYSYMVNNRG